MTNTREMTVEDHNRALAQQQQNQRPRLECEQIIHRASSINKNLIERMQNSQIGKTYICGRDFRTKQLWVLGILFVLFLLSGTSAILIWFTSSFDNFIISHLMIVPNTEMYDNWATPEYKPHVKVHVFNYTNIDEFKAGRAKRLKVKDVGPYYYEETKEKINIHFHENGTATYQERLNHRFVPRLSKGRQSDMLTVPNMLTFSAAKRTESSIFMQWTASMAVGSTFLKQPAHRLIWGYDDNRYSLMKGMLSFQNQRLQESMGLLAARNGTLPYTLTIDTGRKNMDDLAMVQKWDGKDKIEQWSTDECDNVYGGDGSQFPPYLVREKKPVTVFAPEACRTFPYVFSHETKIVNKTFTVYKYIMPMSVYDTPEKYPENQCYCDMDTGSCAPQGFIDLTHCVFETPLFLSMPHFYNVEPEYFKVDGLEPTYAKAESFLNLHPTMGFAVTGSYKFQINVLAKSLFGFSSMSMFRDDTMLPIAWVDIGVEEIAITQKQVNTIYRTTFMIRNIELSVKYVSILVTMMCAAAIIIISRSKWEKTVKSCVTSPERNTTA